MADIIYASVALFAVAVVLALTFNIQAAVFPPIQAQLNKTDPTGAASGIVDDARAVFPMFDIMFVMIFFGAMTIILALAYLLPTNPVSIAVTVIAMMVSLVVTPVVTNSWMEIAASLPDADVSESLPMMYFVMQKYPLFVMVFAVLLLILLYARFRNDPKY